MGILDWLLGRQPEEPEEPEMDQEAWKADITNSIQELCEQEGWYLETDQEKNIALLKASIARAQAADAEQGSQPPGEQRWQAHVHEYETEATEPAAPALEKPWWKCW